MDKVGRPKNPVLYVTDSDGTVYREANGSTASKKTREQMLGHLNNIVQENKPVEIRYADIEGKKELMSIETDKLVLDFNDGLIDPKKTEIEVSKEIKIREVRYSRL